MIPSEDLVWVPQKCSAVTDLCFVVLCVWQLSLRHVCLG